MFELAEDSALELDSYIELGQLVVATSDDQIVGHLQLVETQLGAEIKSMAVFVSHRRRGIGAALVAEAIQIARAAHQSTLVVATAAADTDNLRFYQRQGFRIRSIERDAFTAAAGYDPEAKINGIPLRDRVWLDLSMDRARNP
ncbi:MAG TPA: GNAT family N-acetyltransferase [Solirubrobacterales bacterium]